MKYVLLIAVILVAMLVCSCEHSDDLIESTDTYNVTVQLTETSTDITVQDSSTDDISVTSVDYETTSSENIDTNTPTEKDSVTNGIPLNFEPYTLPTAELDIPDDGEYYEQYSDYKENISVLGHQVNYKKLYYKRKNGDSKRYTICTDVTTNEVILQSEEFYIYDYDNDGNYEASYDNHLIINQGDDILSADIETPFVNYIESTLADKTDYEYRIGQNYFRYTIYDDIANKDDKYEDHQIEAKFIGDGFEFVYERIDRRDLFAPFESNDPDWNVEVSYTDIHRPSPNNEDYIYKLYTLTICGPNSERYLFYEYVDVFDKDTDFVEYQDYRTIDANKYGDTRMERKLIVHPELNYMALIVPYTTEWCSDIPGTNVYILKKDTGYFAGTLLGQAELWDCLADKSIDLDTYNMIDVFTYSIHTVTTETSITDYGFVTDYKVTSNTGDVVFEKEYTWNLKK